MSNEEQPYAPPEQEIEKQVEIDNEDSFWHGFIFGWLGHLVGGSALAPLGGVLVLLFLGIAQLVYLVPFSLVLLFYKKRKMAAGVWAVIGITFLLNLGSIGLCFAFFPAIK